MGMSVYTDKGINYPVLTCDTCGEAIKDVRRAMITIPELCGTPIVPSSGLYHKGHCDPGRTAYRGWDELSTYMRQLICNLRLGEIVTDGSRRQLVIDLPELDGLSECGGPQPW